MATKINPATQVANGPLAAGVIVPMAQDFFLPGMLMDFSGTVAPTGWLACPTGQTNISRTTYANLFAAIGTTWGAGDGANTFGMPWFPADYASVQANANVGTQTVGAVIAHSHVIAGGDGTTADTAFLRCTNNAPNHSTQSTGGSANYAASVRILKCVKY